MHISQPRSQHSPGIGGLGATGAGRDGASGEDMNGSASWSSGWANFQAAHIGQNRRGIESMPAGSVGFRPVIVEQGQVSHIGVRQRFVHFGAIGSPPHRLERLERLERLGQ